MSFPWPAGLPRNLYALGIYGHGVSALAGLVHARTGAPTAGSDRGFGQRPAVHERIVQQGIEIFPEDGTGPARFLAAHNLTPDQVWVLASPAVEDDTPDMCAIRALGMMLLKLPQAITCLLAGNHSIAVSGTSGKSSVTAMIGHILAISGQDPTVYVGAALRDTGLNWRLGSGPAWVVEADESQEAFVDYHPTVALVTNISPDHRPLERLCEDFRQFCEAAGRSIIGLDCPVLSQLALTDAGTFGFHPDSTVRALPDTVIATPDGTAYDLVVAGQSLGCFHVSQPGRHGVLNALAAIAAAHGEGIPPDQAARTLESFTGLARRFEVSRLPGDILVVNDYAHNPAKIACALEGAALFGRRRVLVFEPHGYAPLRDMLVNLVHVLLGREDPATHRAVSVGKTTQSSLLEDDAVIITEVYYRGGTVERDISSRELVDQLRQAGCDAHYAADRSETLALARQLLHPGDCLVITGARDIDSILADW